MGGWLAGRFWAKVMPLRDPTCKLNLQDFSWAEIPKLGLSVAKTIRFSQLEVSYFPA